MKISKRISFFLIDFMICGLLFIGLSKLTKNDSNSSKCTSFINVDEIVNQNQDIGQLNFKQIDKDSTIFLEDIEDEVVIINFLASWCGPCKEELPSIIDLKKELQKKGVQAKFVFLSDEKKDKIAKFASKHLEINKDFYSYSKKEIPQVFWKSEVLPEI